MKTLISILALSMISYSALAQVSDEARSAKSEICSILDTTKFEVQDRADVVAQIELIKGKMCQGNSKDEIAKLDGGAYIDFMIDRMREAQNANNLITGATIIDGIRTYSGRPLLTDKERIAFSYLTQLINDFATLIRSGNIYK